MDYLELMAKIPQLKDAGILVKVAHMNGWTVEFWDKLAMGSSGTQDNDKRLIIGVRDFDPSLVQLWIDTLAHEIGHIISNCDLMMYKTDRTVKLKEEINAWKNAYVLLNTYLPDYLHGKNLELFLYDVQYSINTYVRTETYNQIQDPNEDEFIFIAKKNHSKKISFLINSTTFSKSASE